MCMNVCRLFDYNAVDNNRTFHVRVFRRQPKREEETESNGSEMEYQGDTEEVYKLPAPEPLPYDEYGNQIRVRVPPPLAKENEEFDINYVSSTS
jgi:hypothetical protein